MSSLLIRTRKYSDCTSIRPSYSLYKVSVNKKEITSDPLTPLPQKNSLNSPERSVKELVLEQKEELTDEVETVSSPSYYDLNLEDFEEVDDHFIL
jgi:predicted  nucleic acid-binding Zn-ribbon protein